MKIARDVNAANGVPIEAPPQAAPDGDGIGARLRQRRKLRGLSLKEVAARGGLSIGLLSQIERGLSSPSLRALLGVCAALDLPVGRLFEAEAERGNGDGLVVRAGGGRRIDLGDKGMVKELLTPDACQGLQLMRVLIRPGGASGNTPYATQGHARAAVVLSGSLGLDVESRTLTLHAGDGFAFEGLRALRFWCAGEGPCEVIWAVTPALY